MEYIAARARHVLLQWFEQHRCDPRMEVEARVKDVDQAGFHRIGCAGATSANPIGVVAGGMLDRDAGVTLTLPSGEYKL